jgi:hypothetical protein
MDMEIVRLANASWLQITDWQVFAMRAVGLPLDGSRSRPATTAGSLTQHLPPLDWPPDLFGNEPFWR